MSDASDTDVRRYHRRQFALTLADLALGAMLLAWWSWGGAAAWLAGLLEASLGSPLAVVAAMALAVGGSQALLTFPLDLVAGFVLPRRAGLLTQPLGGWLGDRAKALAIGGILGLLTVEVVYALLRWSPDWWWLWAGTALAAGLALLAAIVPMWLVPLFYRVTPVEDPTLRERILALAARVGVKAARVAVADFSRKGRTANAAVVGLGRTRRILVSDTLLAEFPAEEVEVVLAHELVHHARRHVAKGVLLQGGLLLAALWIADGALRTGAAALGLAGPADPAGLPFFALVVTALGLAATPLVAAWSRRLEREADRVALEVTRTPDAFVAAMERLGRLNLAERRPGRVRELLFATHPSIEARIAAGRAAGARFPARPGLP
ncbi:MAG TPA: M48 family metalloprotease [Methylomirabilota bacterium]|jgi:STE24 endopeptidase|nr:M48 family metalloprotease [Methylomirabilota bacterium]